MKNKNLLIVLTVIIILAMAGLIYYTMHKTQPLEQPVVNSTEGEIINAVTFVCADSKTIGAQFRANSVDLQLSDGRTMTVPQTMSASGARYANADESFVFWNKGDTAFVTENNETTYQDCIIKDQPII